MRRPDLSDTNLVRMLVAALAVITAWFFLRGALPEQWRTPGSPQLYLAGVGGAALLLVPVAFTIAKRGGRSARPVWWFDAHVVCSIFGAVLVAIHSAGFLRRPPALLFLAIIALAVLGIWARTRGARRMAATFASRAPRFGPPDAATREALRALLSRKRAVLAELEPHANEGTFSVTLGHFVRKPYLSWMYRRLAQRESALLGVRRAADTALAWWRPLHMALASVFVLGVLIHVATVTFFAGYVADGGPVTWWHLTRW